MAKLSEALASLDHDGALVAAQAGLNAGLDPLDLIEEARQGLEVVGEQYDCGNFYLMELMWAAQIFEDAAELLAPQIAAQYGATASKGTVLMGTVKGDIHDLGKNIVRRLLECAGLSVIDLGVDVPAVAFVQGIREHRPQVVGLSALLTAAVAELNRTVEAIEEAGLRPGLKIIAGGGVVGEIRGQALKVDHATTNAREGVRLIEQWVADGMKEAS
jgi:methanogenic corrinoid protein MtbC1